MVHPILSKSQCWCVNGGGLFMLRIRGNNFWRIELPNTSSDEQEQVTQLKTTFARVLQYETTACPFQRDFYIELPEVSPFVKRPWKPKHSAAIHGPNAQSSILRPLPASDMQELLGDRRHDVARFSESPKIPQTPKQMTADVDTILEQQSPQMTTVEQHVLAYEQIAASEPLAHGFDNLESSPPILTGQGTRADLHADRSPHPVVPALALYLENDGVEGILAATNGWGPQTHYESVVAHENHLQDSPPEEHRTFPVSALDLTPTENEAVAAKRSLGTPGPECTKTASLPCSVGTSYTDSVSQLGSKTVSSRPSRDFRTTFEQQLPTALESAPPSAQSQTMNPSAPLNTGSRSKSSSMDSFHSLASSDLSSHSAPSTPASMSIRNLQSGQANTVMASSFGDSSPLQWAKFGIPGSIAPQHAIADSRSFVHQHRRPSHSRTTSHERDTVPDPIFLRREFQRRRLHSPPPAPANLCRPSMRPPASYFSAHVLLKTCSLLLGPPVQIIAVMLTLAAKIANGTIRGGTFTYDANGQPVPYSCDLEDDHDSNGSCKDDFGMSLTGRSQARKRNESRRDNWEID